MPGTTAYIGYGGILEYSSDGSSYTVIGGVIDVPFPDVGVKDVDISNNSSPNATEEWMPGMIQPGELEFQIIFASATYATLYAILRQTKYWRITLSDAVSSTGSRWVVQGYIKGLSGAAPLDDKMTAQVKIKVTQKPTFTQAS